MASLLASLRIFHAATMPKLRQKSLVLTGPCLPSGTPRLIWP
jgi:hypothetical protein